MAASFPTSDSVLFIFAMQLSENHCVPGYPEQQYPCYLPHVQRFHTLFPLSHQTHLHRRRNSTVVVGKRRISEFDSQDVPVIVNVGHLEAFTLRVAVYRARQRMWVRIRSWECRVELDVRTFRGYNSGRSWNVNIRALARTCRL